MQEKKAIATLLVFLIFSSYAILDIAVGAIFVKNINEYWQNKDHNISHVNRVVTPYLPLANVPTAIFYWFVYGDAFNPFPQIYGNTTPTPTENTTKL